MYANGSRAQPFVVIKGYHMGSAWFEEAFNKLRGVSFFFEYEHCLRDLAPAGSHLASAMLTFRHLQQSCGSCTDQQRTTRCRACGVVPPPIGSTLHRTSAGSNVQWPAAAPSEAPCVATGISFAAIGPVYMQHLLALRQLMPTLPVLVHVRSNLVKHALSYLRQACPGEKNHVTKTGAKKKRALLHVPPARLLLRVRSIVFAQQAVLRRASQMAGGGAVHRIVYEAMQADIGAELRRVLRAVGVAPPAEPPPAEHGAMVKAGFDDLRAALANFGELDAALAPLRCLHEMLHATAPRIFPLKECQGVGEVLMNQRQQPGHGGLNLSVALDMARVEDHDRAATLRSKELSPSNCEGRADPSAPATRLSASEGAAEVSRPHARPPARGAAATQVPQTGRSSARGRGMTGLAAGGPRAVSASAPPRDLPLTGGVGGI